MKMTTEITLNKLSVATKVSFMISSSIRYKICFSFSTLSSLKNLRNLAIFTSFSSCGVL